MTSTSTASYTFAYTASYLSDTILGSVADIVAALGLDPVRSAARTALDHEAIARWIEEQSLDTVTLEFLDGNGRALEVFEFEVVYGTDGDADFYADQASLARYRAKLKRLPSSSRWRLVCSYRSAHTSMPGWSPTTKTSTDGMASRNFGTIGSGPGANTKLRHRTQT